MSVEEHGSVSPDPRGGGGLKPEADAACQSAASLPIPHSLHATPTFRWQALFQQSSEPLFLLSRRRRILFVNHAWEALTGLPAAQARGLVCRVRTTAEPGAWEEVVARVL